MKFNKFILSLLTVAAVLFASTEPLRAQVTPQTIAAVSGLPTVINAATASNSLTGDITLYKDSGLGLAATFVTGTGTSNVVVWISPTVDGTNFATSGWEWTTAATATTAKTITTNWSAAQLRGYVKLRITSVTNQNASIVTNQGFYYNRPSP